MGIDPNTWPRLYHAGMLATGGIIALTKTETHYIKDVLRRRAGDPVRIFNGINGEFSATFSPPSRLEVADALRAPVPAGPVRALCFTPLPKDRLDFLIEKAVELGATHLCPYLSDRATIRALNADRLQCQIIESLEQCERLTPPVLAPLIPFDEIVRDCALPMPIDVAIERMVPSGPETQDNSVDKTFLVGPPGGWSAREQALFYAHPDRFRPVSLGSVVVRSETAALALLARAMA